MVRQASDWAVGPINALVNNALVNYQFNGDARHHLDTIPWDALQSQIDGAMRGSLNNLQACRSGMQAAGGGCVVNIGTNLFQNPLVLYHDYTAAKGALLALTRTPAKEWGPQGIRVHMDSGGLLRSTDVSSASPAEVFGMISTATPLRKDTAPEEVAEAMVMLLSPLARGITGQNSVVDGGLVIN